MAFKLLVETSTFDKDDYEYIVEETDKNSPRTMYIKGPFMGADIINRNKRKYPLEEMAREVDRYRKEMIDTNRAMGELNHPASADVNLERACHVITEMKQDGSIFHGKSKVLSTPCGLIVRSLINDGIRVGVSSRSLGQLVESTGFNLVKEMRLVAVDCVADPSYGAAFVGGCLESKQWVLGVDGTFQEAYDTFEKGLGSLPKHEVNDYLKALVLEFLQKIH
jgi:Prohead core protein serine protease